MDKSSKQAWIIIAFLAYCIAMYAITFAELAPEVGKSLGVEEGQMHIGALVVGSLQ